MTFDTVEESDFEESHHGSSTEEFVDESASKAKKRPTIGAAENRRVVYSKILVAVVLVVCAALTAFLTHTHVKSEELNTFESEVRIQLSRSLLHLCCPINDSSSSVYSFFSSQGLLARSFQCRRRRRATLSRSCTTFRR